MNINTIIVDDFLDNPDIVRNSALQIDINRTGAYPGYRSDRADYEYEGYIKEKIEKVINSAIKEWKQDSFQFQICFEDDTTWIHHDETEWAGILYLTPNAPVGSGTGIYRHKETGKYFGPGDENYRDDTLWEPITAIGNVYNRLALYKGQMYHRSIIPGFGHTNETGRLTQVFFFNTYEA